MAERGLNPSRVKAAVSGWSSKKRPFLHPLLRPSINCDVPTTILYAEDEQNDVFFLRRAFKLAGLAHSLNHVPDGAQAVDYLVGIGVFADCAQHPFPDSRLLDIS